jgi:hypothetical protein
MLADQMLSSDLSVFKKYIAFYGIQNFIAVNMAALWDVTICYNVIETDQFFRGLYCLRHLGHIHTRCQENLKLIAPKSATGPCYKAADSSFLSFLEIIFNTNLLTAIRPQNFLFLLEFLNKMLNTLRAIYLPILSSI